MWTSRHRTLDEWLHEPPFVLTQCLVTIFGLFFVLVFAGHVWQVLLSPAWQHLFPPPPPVMTGLAEENAEVGSGTYCSAFAPREISIAERLLGVALGVLPVWGMAVVWRRPRAGFLRSGIGLALILVSFRVSVLLAAGIDNAMEKCFNPLWDTMFLVVLLWLAFAWWKVGPDPRLSGGLCPDPREGTPPAAGL